MSRHEEKKNRLVLSVFVRELEFTEEELENAKIMAGNIFLKKSSGLIPPIAFTVREYTTAI